MLWLLRLLGAPRDPEANEQWQCRHPARVSFAYAAMMSGLGAVYLLLVGRGLRVVVLVFSGALAGLWAFAYVGARFRISQGKGISRRR